MMRRISTRRKLRRRRRRTNRQFVSITEYAEITGIPRVSVYRMCKDGRLPAIMVNEEWRVDSQARPRQYRPVFRIPSRPVKHIPEGYVSLKAFAALHGVTYHTVIVWLLHGRIDVEPLRELGTQRLYLPATTPVKASLLVSLDHEESYASSDQ